MFNKRQAAAPLTMEVLLRLIKDAKYGKPIELGNTGDLDLAVVKAQAEAAEEDLVLIIERKYFLKTHKPKQQPSQQPTETEAEFAKRMKQFDYSKSSLE